MNKEDVRQKMLDIVGDIYHAKFAEHGLNGYTKFDGHTLDEAKYTINKAFDRITIDHQKVKLPREVGEELDQFAACYVDVLQFAYHLYALSATEFPALVNWMCSAERRWVIIDAYRYGWEAEPEAKWYVKVPDSWNGPACEYPWTVKCSDGEGVVRGSERENDPRYQFTRAELKLYHLDSDIFTLVPVEYTEVSR